MPRGNGESNGLPVGHPIQVVARRTGLTADVLRAWERRYRVVVPIRTPTGRRLYSEADIERLRLLRQATLSGRSIGQVAGLDSTALQELVREDAEQEAQAPVRRPTAQLSPAELDGLYEEALAAVAGLDPERLEDVFLRASVALSRPDLLERLLAPLLETIGDRWRDGSLRIAHEHVASVVARSFIGAMSSGPVTEGAPLLLATTPAGQAHEFGALLVASTAAAEGWRTTYLGANLPAEEIAAAAQALGARVVALSVVYPADDPRLPRELGQLRKLLPSTVEVLVGGQGAGRQGALLDELGLRYVPTLAELRQQLEQIRSL